MMKFWVKLGGWRDDSVVKNLLLFFQKTWG